MLESDDVTFARLLCVRRVALGPPVSDLGPACFPSTIVVREEWARSGSAAGPSAPESKNQTTDGKDHL